MKKSILESAKIQVKLSDKKNKIPEYIYADNVTKHKTVRITNKTAYKVILFGVVCIVIILLLKGFNGHLYEFESISDETILIYE